MKTIQIKWLQTLDAGEVEQAKEEACVDCYGEQEQASGLRELAAQELAFPFPAKVMGESVEVVDTASSKYDPLGLELMLVHKGKQYAIAAHCVEMVKPLPEGWDRSPLVATFHPSLDWVVNFPSLSLIDLSRRSRTGRKKRACFTSKVA